MFGRDVGRRQVALAAAVVVVGIALACAEQNAGPPTAAKGNTSTIRRVPSAIVAERVAEERAKYSHVISVHNEAMNDLVRNTDKWVDQSGDKRTRICAALTRLTRKYAALVHDRLGTRGSDEDLQTEIDASVRNVKQCGAPAGASIFGTSRRPGLLAVARLQEPEVSGAFAPFMDALATAEGPTDGSPGATSSAMSSVLNDAAALPDADFQVVAAGADLGNSSSSYWYPTLGGGDGRSTELMMLFPNSTRRRIGPIAYIVGADLIGCAAGAASSWWSGARDRNQLVGQCVIWGLSASGGAYLGIRLK